MRKISRKTVIYEMASCNPPAERCASGETVVFETYDCFEGQITSEDMKMETLDFGHTNPATGPLYVEGAEKGDILKVEILDIRVDEQGVMCQIPGAGVTGALVREEITKIVPVKDDACLIGEKEIKIHPMIGVIGVAPEEGEAINTGTPDYHGGNMDCKRIIKGSTLYLPVCTKGALLAMGDLHAVMGDGEVCVCGVEIAGEVTVRVTVLKGIALPTPFLVTNNLAMTIYSEKTLDAAAKGAVLRMQRFLGDAAGLGRAEAGFLLSACGNTCICQMVDPNKTVRMEIPVEILDDFLSRLENNV